MSSSNKSINRDILRGIGWSAAMRWVMRAIGFFSIIITARLLDPEDFGIWAMTMVTFGLAEAFSELGVQQLLIRSDDESREQRDTAWTLRILQTIFVASVVLAAAPLAANYFDESRIVPVTLVLAASTVITGFSNIGLVIARKELNFELDFRFNVYNRLAKFIATIGLAIVLRDYWALVYGYFFGSCIAVLLSYRLHPYRPRFCLKHYREYLRFASAIIPQRIGKSLYNRLDSIIVGGVANTSQLGFYNIASQLSNMAANEIALPVSRGLYPNFAKVVSQPKLFAVAYCRVLAATCSIVLPVTVTFLFITSEFVSIVFGEKWLPILPFMPWLIVWAAIESITVIMSQQILIVSGHEKQAAIFMWIKLTLLAVFLSVGVSWQGTEGVAMMRPFVALISFFIATMFLTRFTPVELGMLCASLWRPVVACAIVYFSMIVIFGHTPLDQSDYISIILKASASIAMYTSSIFFLWLVTGKPEGLESLATAYLLDRLRRTGNE